MVYQVCALVLTIIFGMVGVYIVIVLNATKGLINETRKALKTMNENLPVPSLGIISSLMDVVKLGLKVWRFIQKGENKMESA